MHRSAVLIVCLSSFGWAQAPSTRDLNHGLEHLKELDTLRRIASPEKATRKQLDSETQDEIRRSLAASASDPDLPKSTRSSVKNMLKSKDIADYIYQIEDPSAPNHVKPNLVVLDGSLQDSLIKIQQVVTTHVPAISITPPVTGGAGAGSNTISSCQGGGNFYPNITQQMFDHTAQIRALSDSVGRIESKRNDGTGATLLGTAFVVDRSRGVVATACHVVDSIATYNPAARTWILKSTAGSTLLLDFGESAAHDPAREFRVQAVEFVPSLEGCDGALLRIDTGGRALPAELSTATAEPGATAMPLNVISIGYPGDPGDHDTTQTKTFFDCLRKAAPTSSKFAFGGMVTRDEVMQDYHILTHILPTVGGQSGSPVIDATDLNHPRVVGIHICCSTTAVNPFGLPCEHRNEIFLQEAVSIVDLLGLYRSQIRSKVSPGASPTSLPLPHRESGLDRFPASAATTHLTAGRDPDRW